jgi:hypothetical protein
VVAEDHRKFGFYSNFAGNECKGASTSNQPKRNIESTHTPTKRLILMLDTLNIDQVLCVFSKKENNNRSWVFQVQISL